MLCCKKILNVRQIHLFEPWHNRSRLEQVIGRGIRKCSHISLPLEKRNVTIFLSNVLKFIFLKNCVYIDLV